MARSYGCKNKNAFRDKWRKNMRVDLYTKGVLTVIAACLVYLCSEVPLHTVHADPGPQPVYITGTRVPLAVGIVGTSYNEITNQWIYSAPIPVKQVNIPH
jgi:hypothetical protein